MYKVGKYLLEAENPVQAANAVLYLNRRKSLDREGVVVVKGQTICYTLLKSKKWFDLAVELSKPVAAVSASNTVGITENPFQHAENNY